MALSTRVGRDQEGADDTGSMLLLTELFPPYVGGSAVLFDNIYSRIREARVLVLTDGGGASSALERRGPLEIRRDRLATTRWGVLHPLALQHHWRVVQMLRSAPLRRAAVVHCGRALPEGLQAYGARWFTGLPYLCWTHGEEIAYAKTSRELTALTHLVHRHAAAVIANSHHTAKMLQAFGVESYKIHVVHPGVDPSRFHPAANASDLRRRLAAANEVVLLSVGRLQRRKGHDVVIRALASVRRQYSNLRYVIVGDGDERGRLEAMVRELELQDVVRFEGEVASEALPLYYSACDLFVMPNRVEGVDIEGFGIVFLEAAAAGKPTIGGRSGGVPEAIDEGRSGLLVSGTDVDELAIAIRELVASSDLRERLGEAGRQRVVEGFTWERAAIDVARLHHQLSGSGSKSSAPRGVA